MSMISRRELRAALKISGETLRVWRIAGKLPPPDVNMSERSQWWRLDTLEAAGIRLAAANPPTPPAS